MVKIHTVYDVSKCEITFLGISISDFGSDYVAKIEFDNDLYSLKRLLKGGTFYARNNQQSGVLTIQLLGSSKTLENMLIAMDLTQLLDVGFLVTILDENEFAPNYVLTQCVFKSLPSVIKKDVVENVEIKILFGKSIQQGITSLLS